MRTHALRVDEAVDRAEQVILRHVPLQAELVEERTLVDAMITHHGRLSPTEGNQPRARPSTAFLNEVRHQRSLASLRRADLGELGLLLPVRRLLPLRTLEVG